MENHISFIYEDVNNQFWLELYPKLNRIIYLYANLKEHIEFMQNNVYKLAKSGKSKISLVIL